MRSTAADFTPYPTSRLAKGALPNPETVPSTETLIDVRGSLAPALQLPSSCSELSEQPRGDGLDLSCVATRQTRWELPEGPGQAYGLCSRMRRTHVPPVRSSFGQNASKKLEKRGGNSPQRDVHVDKILETVLFASFPEGIAAIGVLRVSASGNTLSIWPCIVSSSRTNPLLMCKHTARR